MSERYWVTGVQLGILEVCNDNTKGLLLDEIEDKQFIGRMKEPYEDYEIVIVKKVKP